MYHIKRHLSVMKATAAIHCSIAIQLCVSWANVRVSTTLCTVYVTYSVSESEKALCGHNRPKKAIHIQIDLRIMYLPGLAVLT